MMQLHLCIIRVVSIVSVPSVQLDLGDNIVKPQTSQIQLCQCWPISRSCQIQVECQYKHMFIFNVEFKELQEYYTLVTPIQIT